MANQHVPSNKDQQRKDGSKSPNKMPGNHQSNATDSTQKKR